MKKQQSIEEFLAGHKEKGINYQYFVPAAINKQWIWEDGSLNALLEKASIKLGELNAFARLVPDVSLFIQLHITKEAVVSSKIEGTQTNMGEALLPVEEIEPERKNDWKEVKNYTKALNNAIVELEKLPLASRLLCNAHKNLLEGVRGEHKQPGKFRKSQNWIGGTSLADAVFIPPAHHYIDPLMSDLENFLHNTKIHVPALIRIGLAHYQFETIHPFLDGNGRIGRLLITLFLVSENILEKPLLYLSAFFEKNRTLYYDNLSRVREKNDLAQWLKFFLIGVEQTATNAVDKLAKMVQLKSDLEHTIHDQLGRRSANGLKLLVQLFRDPVVTIKKVEEICKLSTKSANEMVNRFVENKWLKRVGSSERYRIFIFEPYLKLFE